MPISSDITSAEGRTTETEGRMLASYMMMCRDLHSNIFQHGDDRCPLISFTSSTQKSLYFSDCGEAVIYFMMTDSFSKIFKEVTEK